MKRRSALLAALPPLLPTMPLLSLPARAASEAEPVQRLATAWRVPAPAAGASADRVGIIEIDWAAGRARVQAELPMPGRAHGLLAMPDGGFLVVANRPGRWLLRCDAAGRLGAHRHRQLRYRYRPAFRNGAGHSHRNADDVG